MKTCSNFVIKQNVEDGQGVCEKKTRDEEKEEF